MGEGVLLNSHKLNLNKGSVKATKIYNKEQKSFIFYTDACPLPAVAHEQAAHIGTGGPL